MTDTPELFDSVERIAILRGGGIGDLLSTMPALEAIRAVYPTAEQVMLTTPLLASLLEDRPGPVDRAIVVPVFPDAVAPDGRGWREHPETMEVIEKLRADGVDLALQLHGGGRNSNPFVNALEARHTVGCATPDAEPLERVLPHLYYQREAARWLEVVALAGAAALDHEPRFIATRADAEAARPWLAPEAPGLVVVHGGATDPRRRWPAERFAAVAAELALDGWQVIVVGDPSERELADGIAERAADLAGGAEGLISSAAGRTSVRALVGLLAHARLVVANDSGPRHLAQALGTPTASVYWVGNLINAGPDGRRLHRVQIAWRGDCPVCGADGTNPFDRHCDHTVTWVDAVPTEAVLQDARDLLAGR
ncbi:glycosyltransferase family 9 protein [Sinomonas sp.]|uniref:glycosyltransferase family 9 protein n=1 Tax=Sinomonas sp. TaxID=1914986 RepID=UPI002FE17B12